MKMQLLFCWSHVNIEHLSQTNFLCDNPSTVKKLLYLTTKFTISFALQKILLPSSTIIT